MTALTQRDAQRQHESSCDCCGPENADYAAFEEWRSDATDATQLDWHCDFLDSLKAGVILGAKGWDAFDGWLYEHRWPQARRRA